MSIINTLNLIYSNLILIHHRGKLLSHLDDTILEIDKGRCSVSYINPFVLANPIVYELAQQDRHFFVVDSIFTATLLRLALTEYKSLEIQNFDFSGIADRLFEHSVKRGTKLVICGGRSDELERFHSILVKRHPSIRVDRVFNGYDTRTYREYLLEYGGDPDTIIIIGLGSPKQEKQVLNIRRSGAISSVVLTCGGFITQTSRAINGEYYPKNIVKFRLRFLYRFWKEPKTIHRVVKYYPLFFIAILFLILRKSEKCA